MISLYVRTVIRGVVMLRGSSTLAMLKLRPLTSWSMAGIARKIPLRLIRLVRYTPWILLKVTSWCTCPRLDGRIVLYRGSLILP